MKAPIEPGDIKTGDVLLACFKSLGADYEVTFTAQRDGMPWTRVGERNIDSPVQHYLLDRPTPRVELPVEPTLGWVDGRLGVWHGDHGLARTSIAPAILVDHIAAFTPATAVPTEALDDLRKECSRMESFNREAHVICTFLAVVDEANR